MSCDYCNWHRKELITNDSITVKIDGDNEIEIEYLDGRDYKYKWIKIDYCPKCGQRLERRYKKDPKDCNPKGAIEK